MIARLLALLLVLAGAGVLVAVFRPEPPAEAIELASSRQCLECHADVAAEWQASHHSIAYTNPEVVKLSQDFRNEECLACHAPRPVLLFAPGERVLARASERALGVDCLACHAHPDGGVATSNPRPSAKAPCRPRTTPRIQDVDHCGSCHNQHATVEQWRASPAEIEGQPIKGDGCLHCHMPVAWRAGGRQGSDHSFRAGHDLGALQQAVRLTGEWRAGALVRLVNFGAAHNFPTDERSRAADLQLRWRQGGEWGEWQHLWRFRDPYRDETDLTNTQLPSGETWEQQVDAPPGADGAEARLLYRTNPFQPDDEATEVARLLLEP
ncbi:MAG: hypothetical protein ISR76_04315 [Planctomycetes bacterium]|nr:hypothetical protein [Planctomycetota bacterium]MBL7008198.1 hypothetical protein [Planctomycetota bacterium]